MPWIHAILKGQKVLAKAKADGTFDAQGGRVEIRYKPTDTRAYRAGAGNLERIAGAELIADDAVVAGEAVASKEERSAARKTEAAKAAADPASVPKDAWVIYADGACSGNPGPAGAGVYFRSPDGKEYDCYEYLGTATNNVAELTAILRAAELVPVGAAAVVRTDSQYSIGVLQKGWKAKANQELIAKVKTALKDRGKSWVLQYVPGHAGVAGNERADELAREAVSSRRSQMPTIPGA